MISRREVLKGGIGAAVVACAVHRALGIPATIGISSGTPAGYFPNSAPAFLPMRQVYPAPTGVGANEPHQFAYFDATNNTAHGFQYQKRIGVSFGRWPFIYQLVSGPPGMAFGATVWNTAWDGQGDAAYKAGYGQLRWTPTAAISSSSPTLVSVNVIDQDNNVLNIQWNIHTADDITKTGGMFAFINADTGSDTTGTGGYATPWQTPAHAIGTSAIAAGAAPAGSVLVPMGATAAYIFPQTSTNVFTWNSTYKPASIIGIPGQTATFDMSSGAGTSGTTGVGVAPSSSGLFAQDITIENYTDIADYRAFTWSFLDRITFQGIIWNTAGYGSSPTNNASMFYVQGGGTGNGTYLFITGCEENGRQADSQENNCAGWQLYSTQEFVGELNLASSPSNAVGECYYQKSDVGYGCCRANAAFFASCDHGFDFDQTPYQGSNSSESAYNVGVNIANIYMPEDNGGGNNGYSFGDIAFRRNSIVSGGSGLYSYQSAFNMTAPYTNANTAPYNINTLVPASTTATTGGSLAANPWAYVITTLGVSGESSIDNSNATSEILLTSTGNTSVNTIYWLTVPGNNGYRIYRGSAGTGSENQYVTVAAGVDSLADNGSLSWTPGTPPPSSTAVSASRFNFDSNVIQNPTQTTDPTGAAMGSDGHNQYAASGLLNTTTGLLVTSNGGKYGAQLA